MRILQKAEMLEVVDSLASPQTSFGVRLSRIHFSVGEKSETQQLKLNFIQYHTLGKIHENNQSRGIKWSPKCVH